MQTTMAGNSQIRRLFSGRLKTSGSKSESFSSPGSRFPRSFDMDRAVGLGIVAAMKDGDQLSPVAKSDPVPIVFSQSFRQKEKSEHEKEEMELSEGYSFVISHVGPASPQTVYVEDGWEVFGTPPSAPVRPWVLSPAEDFLSLCFRCGKNLNGIDIFMYRGEKGFCSAECRLQQMVSEEQREKKPFDCSMSPCSASVPIFFAAGVAAA